MVTTAPTVPPPATTTTTYAGVAVVVTGMRAVRRRCRCRWRRWAPLPLPRAACRRRWAAAPCERAAARRPMRRHTWRRARRPLARRPRAGRRQERRQQRRRQRERRPSRCPPAARRRAGAPLCRPHPAQHHRPRRPQTLSAKLRLGRGRGGVVPRPPAGAAGLVRPRLGPPLRERWRYMRCGGVCGRTGCLALGFAVAPSCPPGVPTTRVDDAVHCEAGGWAGGDRAAAGPPLCMCTYSGLMYCIVRGAQSPVECLLFFLQR